jgi:predicted solute-binding protein
MVKCGLNPSQPNQAAEPLVRPRVAAVSYLNTLPLVWGMLHGDQQGIFDLEFCIPAECADRLGSGAADIGIVPVAELGRLSLKTIPGAGIACEGPVRSILLVSTVPIDQIRTVAVDSSSRTSVMLLNVLLSRKYGIEAEFLPMAPDLPSMLGKAEAALVIGDPALDLDPATLPFYVLDLGEEWFEMTKLPMVFAVWASRKEVEAEQYAESFLQSYRFGQAHLEAIEAEASRERGYTPKLIREYLTRNIRFELGEREYRGLELFLQYAAEFQSLNENRKVRA